jgi:hypothetical protein
MTRIGSEISAGDSTAIATWYKIVAVDHGDIDG